MTYRNTNGFCHQNNPESAIQRIKNPSRSPQLFNSWKTMTCMVCLISVSLTFLLLRISIVTLYLSPFSKGWRRTVVTWQKSNYDNTHIKEGADLSTFLFRRSENETSQGVSTFWQVSLRRLVPCHLFPMSFVLHYNYCFPEVPFLFQRGRNLYVRGSENSGFLYLIAFFMFLWFQWHIEWIWFLLWRDFYRIKGTTLEHFTQDTWILWF